MNILGIGYVYVNDIFSGELKQTDEGYIFTYNQDYLKKYDKAVSLTLPLTEKEYFSKTLFSFFDGLIPEGWMLDKVVSNWKLTYNDRFKILLVSSKDSIGNVAVKEKKDEMFVL